MSDLTISEDIIVGIKEGMLDVGWTLQIKIMEDSPIDPNNPGAEPADTFTTADFQGLVFDFDEKYMKGSTVQEGGQMVLVSVDTLTPSQIVGVRPGNYIIDGAEIYSIIRSSPIKVSGMVVAVLAQVKS